jgi:hypothetical protein
MIYFLELRGEMKAGERTSPASDGERITENMDLIESGSKGANTG